jgi:hypothetical protein
MVQAALNVVPDLPCPDPNVTGSPIPMQASLSLCPGTFPLGPEQAFTLPSSLFFFGFEIMIVWSRVDIIREFDKTKTWAFVVFPILKFSDFTKAL